MPDLVIREIELKQLDDLIKPVPTQWGYPLVNFFNSIAIQRQKENEASKSKDEGEKLVVTGQKEGTGS